MALFFWLSLYCPLQFLFWFSILGGDGEKVQISSRYLCFTWHNKTSYSSFYKYAKFLGKIVIPSSLSCIKQNLSAVFLYFFLEIFFRLTRLAKYTPSIPCLETWAECNLQLYYALAHQPMCLYVACMWSESHIISRLRLISNEKISSTVCEAESTEVQTKVVPKQSRGWWNKPDWKLRMHRSDFLLTGKGQFFNFSNFTNCGFN